jgi:hypothetical protein
MATTACLATNEEASVFAYYRRNGYWSVYRKPKHYRGYYQRESYVCNFKAYTEDELREKWGKRVARIRALSENEWETGI